MWGEGEADRPVCFILTLDSEGAGAGDRGNWGLLGKRSSSYPIQQQPCRPGLSLSGLENDGRWRAPLLPRPPREPEWASLAKMALIPVCRLPFALVYPSFTQWASSGLEIALGFPSQVSLAA